ncbi:LOG family protein [Falsiroseomonas tokyonensis]|uniref:AMP nucleosidase n=1 Tax=Falsiroseomonas tokyonensis TaxID=430521 RepID=A0ABV7C0M0_9PROT|nr:LOG family protein [Falsiroseomonas tokyonensis]
MAGVRDNVIATGGGPGIVEAACRGAWEAGAPCIGFNLCLPREQQPNPCTTPELTVQFHYFAIGKLHKAMRARAPGVFPGGFGTLDELFELLALRQTGRVGGLPILLVDEAFWRGLIRWDVLVESGMVEPADLDRLTFAAVRRMPGPCQRGRARAGSPRRASPKAVQQRPNISSSRTMSSSPR